MSQRHKKMFQTIGNKTRPWCFLFEACDVLLTEREQPQVDFPKYKVSTIYYTLGIQQIKVGKQYLLTSHCCTGPCVPQIKVLANRDIIIVTLVYVVGNGPVQWGQV